MRLEDYLRLKEIAVQLLAAKSDEMRKVIGKKLEAEFARIDALVVNRAKAA